MLVSLYINSAGRYEVTLLGRSRMEIFIAYALGFTIEFVLVSVFLYTVVKRAKTIDVELLFTIMRRYLPEEKVRERQTGKRKKLGCG